MVKYVKRFYETQNTKSSLRLKSRKKIQNSIEEKKKKISEKGGATLLHQEMEKHYHA